MEAETSKGAPPAADDGQSPANKLVEGLRDLVRQEMQRPPEPPTPAPAPAAKLPNWKDALWLAVFIADVSLIFSWFPKESQGPFEFLGKFLPWLFGGLFVVANDWFRDRLLEISRAPHLRAVQLTFLVFGFAWGRIPIIPITASVSPPGTQLFIDGQEQATHHTIWLAVGNHPVRISEGREGKDNAAKDREFTLSWGQLLKAACVASDRPDWRLVFPMDVMGPESSTTVTLTKQDGRFDSEFLKAVHLEKFGFEKKSDNSLEFQTLPGGKDKPIELPYGQYSVEGAGCKSSPPFSVDRDQARRGLDLTAECSP